MHPFTMYFIFYIGYVLQLLDDQLKTYRNGLNPKPVGYFSKCILYSISVFYLFFASLTVKSQKEDYHQFSGNWIPTHFLLVQVKGQVQFFPNLELICIKLIYSHRQVLCYFKYFGRYLYPFEISIEQSNRNCWGSHSAAYK